MEMTVKREAGLMCNLTNQNIRFTYTYHTVLHNMHKLILEKQDCSKAVSQV